MSTSTAPPVLSPKPPVVGSCWLRSHSSAPAAAMAWSAGACALPKAPQRHPSIAPVAEISDEDAPTGYPCQAVPSQKL